MYKMKCVHFFDSSLVYHNSVTSLEENRGNAGRCIDRPRYHCSHSGGGLLPWMMLDGGVRAGGWVVPSIGLDVREELWLPLLLLVLLLLL